MACERSSPVGTNAVEQHPHSEAAPLCPRCGKDLAAEDASLPPRLIAVGMLLAAIALVYCAPPGGTGMHHAGAIAAVVLAAMLMPARLRWRCTSCRACFRRRRPPRGSDEPGNEEAQTTEPPDGSG